MQITKFVHSCLLIEEDSKKILIDPGNYSEESLGVNSLNGLDYLLITHEHPDHMYLPLIKKTLEKSPEVKIISNPSVAGILGNEGIKASTDGDKFIKLEEVPHEKIWMGKPVQNVKFIVTGKLTHPGDSHTFTQTTEILALPIQAPWGSTTAAVELAEKLKPKIIIPIHDWHWKDEARENMYKRLAEHFAALSIKFTGLEDGVTINI